MTKYMFLIFLFAILTQISNGQITNYREDVIVNNDIERIDEWKFKFDSLGKLIDSVFLRQLTFNKSGDLIEKRTQYEDHPWTTEEVWAVFKYTYDDNHNLINSQENINYIFVAASDEYRKLINKCETYDFYGNLITAVLTYENDKIESSILRYSEGLYSELLVEKIIYLNGTVTAKYKIHYKKFK